MILLRFRNTFHVLWCKNKCRVSVLQIDPSVVVCMEDEALKKFIPRYGDRVAVFEFCQRFLRTVKKKEGLLERLRKVIKKKNLSKEKGGSDSSSEDQQSKKKRKMSSTRQIELGWLCSINGERFVHVRTKQGGGTRKVTVSKSATNNEILETAIQLFFPNGISTKGKKEEFSFQLKDFKQNVLEDNYTVEEYYAFSKLSRLRFYLASRQKCSTLSKANESN